MIEQNFVVWIKATAFWIIEIELSFANWIIVPYDIDCFRTSQDQSYVIHLYYNFQVFANKNQNAS